MTDDNLPDEMPDVAYLTPRGSGTISGVYVDLPCGDEERGEHKYHHTRQYTGLERDVERLHDYNTHLVNENERLRAALDLAYKMHCDPCNMPEKDIQQIEQALKETT